MRRVATLVAAVFGLATAVAFLHDGPVAAAASQVSVGDAAEGWYSTPVVDSCGSPLGCPPVSTSPATYPANTLHVAATAGGEAARTYVLPQLSAFPASDLPATGVMDLPLATVAGNGNTNVASASIEACLATKPFDSTAAGSTATPPPVDCDVHATLTDATDHFTLDLAPFLAAWRGGSPLDGISLLPDLSGASVSTDWHVTFNGRDLPGATHIISTFPVSQAGSAASPTATSGGTSSSVTPSSGAPATPSSPAAPLALSLPSAGSAPSPLVPTGAAVASGAAAAPAAAGQSPSIAPTTGAGTARPAAGGTGPVASPGATGVSAAAVSRGFQYPEILLLPLAMAIGIVFVVRLLTTDATPKRRYP